ncbi:asparagine synthetase B [Elysia marginata]|uniref:Asparagine synthetase B n=1 Tax=Elysia marginata TaxID=1093978 RepID=A0AAV4JQP7_9GAST|nr:asparagine synthetase B [Elysia marginata]
MGIKVVLSGEGADEIFGGYLYFKNAPSYKDFQKETIDRVQKLSTADCLRADKSTMAHGLEARVPFLDKSFLDMAMSIRPEDKHPETYNGIEKYILRKAFDDRDNPFLPDEVLWRQKEQFSDGVGYSWIDTLIDHCKSQVSDETFSKATEQFPINTPKSKEAYYYRTIFNKHYPQDSATLSVKRWVPKWQENQDPSGLFVCAQDKKVPDTDKDKYAPIKLKLNEDGSKYARFLFFTQVQAGMKKLGTENSQPYYKLRRTRMVVFGQFSPKFLFLFHVGTHGYNAQNAGLGGKGGGDIFINDAWGEYMVLDKKLYIGAGLHFWGAISRQQRTSTFTFLAMDGFTPGWLNLGRSGTFVREFGVYAKGTLGKLQYAVSMNDAFNKYVVNSGTELDAKKSKYAGAYLANQLGEGGARFNYTARLEYQLWDAEGDKLPFKAGSKISKKSNVFNLGAGVWMQPKAAVLLKEGSSIKTVQSVTKANFQDNIKFEDAMHFSADAFLDKNGLTAYAMYLKTDYGKGAKLDNKFDNIFFTGSHFFGKLGYLLTDDKKINLQPYVTYQYMSRDGYDKSGRELKLGVSLFHLGFHLKTTLEFQSFTAPALNTAEVKDATNSFHIQMQFVM